ncbi:MAG: DUF4159 domain-containing protein [Paracoccaceae bacterium]
MPAALGFSQPLLLVTLAGLPLLWLLLRAVPPAARRQRFAAVLLLLGLRDRDRQADRTPWWLLLLRLVAIGAAIIGFAGPVLGPAAPEPGGGPLVVIVDGGWAEAPDWARRGQKLAEVLDQAGREGRTVALVRLTDPPQVPVFQDAGAALARLGLFSPAPFAPPAMAAWAAALPEGGFDSIWLADGLDHPGREDLRAALASRGALRVLLSPLSPLALAAPAMQEGVVTVTALRPLGGPEALAEVLALGPDPAGIERELARFALAFAPGATSASASLALPPELRNRLHRFEIAGQRSAGAVWVAGDALKRRKVAILPVAAAEEGLRLLDQTHYLRQALAPVAEVMGGALIEVLRAGPDVVILADVARLVPAEAEALAEWVAKGGALLRFAGPRLAAAGMPGEAEDPLLPVRLRAGGRAFGGAMSWGEPKPLAPFAAGSPFHGLSVPPDVTVSRQVLAEPGPELAQATIAALADGTPLVTRRVMGAGQVVLFHVSANAEWSSLPLSGLFVQMLERLAVTSGTATPVPGTMAGQTWTAERVLDGFGRIGPGEALAGVDGAALGLALRAGPGPGLPPGVYAEGGRIAALNVIAPETLLAPAVWPAGQAIEGLDPLERRDLKGGFLTLALGLALLDILCALHLSGRLPVLARRGVPLVLAALVVWEAPGARAQGALSDAFALAATEGVVLAYVRTGDAALDARSEAGLRGLSDRLAERTSVEPLPPMGVDVGTDELAFFPFLYWPVSPDQPPPGPAATDRLNAFLRSGGMILFDTRDGDLTAGGTATAEAEALRGLTLGLDIPPLEPAPADHILTRSFYLIQSFPGRHDSPVIWVEAQRAPQEAAEGMPFRPQNDGVTPVVIGGNDWASAWATDDWGVALYPVGRGEAGDRQREAAYRFGINLILHVLTGNYKSDQVHVPALLDRLGQ